MTAVHLQVVFCCALALCAAYFAAKFLANHANFNQGGPKHDFHFRFNEPTKYGECHTFGDDD